MGRRPVEDDQEEEERGQGEVPRRRRPADDRRDRPRCPADHDVLRGRALQVPRVDDHVEEVPEDGEECRENVREAREDDEREGRECEPELERTLRRDASGCHRSPVRAAHVLVDIPVEDVVESGGAATGERKAAKDGCEKAGRGKPSAPTKVPPAAVSRSSTMILGFVSVT